MTKLSGTLTVSSLFSNYLLAEDQVAIILSSIGIEISNTKKPSNSIESEGFLIFRDPPGTRTQDLLIKSQ